MGVLSFRIYSTPVPTSPASILLKRLQTEIHVGTCVRTGTLFTNTDMHALCYLLSEVALRDLLWAYFSLDRRKRPLHQEKKNNLLASCSQFLLGWFVLIVTQNTWEKQHKLKLDNLLTLYKLLHCTGNVKSVKFWALCYIAKGLVCTHTHSHSLTHTHMQRQAFIHTLNHSEKEYE